MKHNLWRSVAECGLVLSTALFLLVPISAQQTLGSINGTVLDPSGAAVPDATIVATNAAINFSRTTTSQSTGFFQMFNLPVGSYTGYGDPRRIRDHAATRHYGSGSTRNHGECHDETRPSIGVGGGDS